MSDKKLKMRIIMAVASIVLLANPLYTITDYLPDCIGYALILLLLGDLSEIYPHFKEARSLFKKLLWISISRFPFMILMNWIEKNHSSEMTLLTVIALAYAVVELIFAIPAFRTFYKGIEYIGEREGVLEIFDGERLKNAKSATLVFVIARSALGFLPTLLLLPASAMDAAEHYGSYVDIAAGICFAVGLIFGIAFIAFTCPYILSLLRSEGINEVIRQRLSEIDGEVKRRHLKNSLFSILNLTAVGVGAFLDITFDSINILPDVICALILLLASIFSFRFVSQRLFRALMATGLLYTLLSLFGVIVQDNFHAKFDYNAISKTDAAEAAYMSVIAVSALETLAFIIFIAVFSYALYSVAREYTGREYNERATELIHRRVRLRLVWFFVFAVLSSLSSLANTVFMAFTKKVPADSAYIAGGEMVIPLFDGFWLVPIILTLVWLIYSMLSFDFIKDEISHKIDEK